MNLNLHLNIELKILIMLCIASYFGAMLIQLKDPETKVEWSDWFLALLTSSVGGVITFFIVRGVIDNIGIRFGIIVTATLVSYRTFKFIVSKEAQDTFADSFWSGVVGIMQKLFKSDNNNNNNNNNNNYGNGRNRNR